MLDIVEGTFEQIVDNYLDWFRGRYPTIAYSQVLIVETPGGGRDDAPDPIGASEFSGRFEEIVNQCSRGWINLTALRLDGDILLLAVEYISGEPRFSRSEISVNFSGLMRRDLPDE